MRDIGFRLASRTPAAPAKARIATVRRLDRRTDAPSRPGRNKGPVGPPFFGEPSVVRGNGPLTSLDLGAVPQRLLPGDTGPFFGGLASVEAAWKTATNFCLRRVNWRGSRERTRMLPKGNAKPLFRASHDRAAGLDAIAAKPYARISLRHSAETARMGCVLSTRCPAAT